MSAKEFALLLFSVMVSVVGQLFLKLGADKLGKVTGNNAFSHFLSMAFTPELIVGLFCYGLGAIAYILLLTRVKLSVVGPSVSLIYVGSVLMGHFFFKETIPVYRLFGLGFIICGVILVVWRN